MNPVMMMPNNGLEHCLHEELLQDHSLKLTAVEAELNYKKERLDELKNQNEKIQDTLNELKEDIKEDISKIVIASKTDDEKLDKRLTKIETRQEVLDDANKKNRDDFNTKLTIITVIFLALTFYFNFIHHL